MSHSVSDSSLDYYGGNSRGGEKGNSFSIYVGSKAEWLEWRKQEIS